MKSQPQNRPLTRQVTYSPVTGNETGRSGFADTHPIDQVVNTGITWHEGQLFGWVNQLIGVLVAVLLMTISVLGICMWLKRKPVGRLGAPEPAVGYRLKWMLVPIGVLGVLLPLFGASVLFLFLYEQTVKPWRSRMDRP